MYSCIGIEAPLLIHNTYLIQGIVPTHYLITSTRAQTVTSTHGHHKAKPPYPHCVHTANTGLHASYNLK